MSMITQKGRKFFRRDNADEDEEVPPERFKLQAELIRRQVEHELEGDSDEELLYFFEADDNVPGYEIEDFVETLSNFPEVEVIVYRGDIEHTPDDELRSIIKDIAPKVGLSVEEVDQ